MIIHYIIRYEASQTKIQNISVINSYVEPIKFHMIVKPNLCYTYFSPTRGGSLGFFSTCNLFASVIGTIKRDLLPLFWVD